MVNHAKVFCWSKDGKLEIFLQQEAGTEVYVTVARWNPALYSLLRDGVRVGELRSFRPARHRGQQRIAGTVRRIIQVVDYLEAEGEVA